MDKVLILMSTYNGQRYLRDQLDSILNQTYEAIDVLIRDDGSSDDTVDIIKEYADRHPQIIYYEGENIGVIHSFFHLINQADDSYYYYALADQDDVWLPEKIESAIRALSAQEKAVPKMYCSEFTLVNEKLDVITTKQSTKKVEPGFGNAIVENIATGCTIVYNRELLWILKKGVPEFTVMHDWWIYLVGAYYGTVIYDNTSYILYRQHGNNTVGASNSSLQKNIKRIQRLTRTKGQIVKQLTSFKEVYSLDIQDELVENVINYKKVKNKARLIFGHIVYRQVKVDDILCKILLMFGWL